MPNKTIDAGILIDGTPNTLKTFVCYAQVLTDNEISFPARGLHCLMRALIAFHGSGWNFYAIDLAKRAGMHRETCAKYLKELENAGYISRDPLKGQGGLFMGFLYIVYPVKRSMMVRLVDGQ